MAPVHCKCRGPLLNVRVTVVTHAYLGVIVDGHVLFLWKEGFLTPFVLV